MKHKKKLSLLLALALGVTPVLTSVNQTKSYAEEDNKVYDKIFVGNKYVYVKKGLNVPEETILDILNQSNSDALIKIENYTKNKEKRKYETRGKRTHVIRDHFTRYIYKNKKVIATVAKGGSYTLNRTINFNQSVSVSGSVEASILSVAKANISANYANEFSDSISVGSVYTGPAENSEYNSRTYYSAIKTKVGYLNIKKVGESNSKFRKVDYEIPVERVEWSVDNKI